MDTRLAAKEKRLKAQFAAMEAALGQLADAARLAPGPARRPAHLVLADPGRSIGRPRRPMTWATVPLSAEPQ